MYQQISQSFIEIGDLEALVMTTYGLDVSYFERYILPAFFPLLGEGPASEPHRPLFEYLEESQIPISVIYDASQLIRGEQLVSSEASVLKELRWQAHPVMPKVGVFHPKLIIALSDKKGDKFLTIGCASANLTRPGWAQNFEVCVLQSIKLTLNVQNSLVMDVLALLELLNNQAKNSAAIQKVLNGIQRVKPKSTANKHLNNYRERLWFGQFGQSLTQWLDKEVLNSDLQEGEWNLDVLSPYYSKELPSILTWASDQFSQSAESQEKKSRIRCYCPRVNGEYDIDYETLEHYRNVGKVVWSSISGESLRSKLKDSEGNYLERFLHAKVYRFWSKHNEILIIGSANATSQGMRDEQRGNYEASMVVSVTACDGFENKSWLKPISNQIPESECKQNILSEDQAVEGESVPEIEAVFDWESKSISLHNKDSEVLVVFLGNQRQSSWVLEPNVKVIETLKEDKVGSLFNSPTLKVKRAMVQTKFWLCLVCETGLYAKPPAPSMERTVDELIRDWQLGPQDRFSERVGLAGLPDDANQMTTYTTESIQILPIEDRLNDMFLAVSQFRKEIESKFEVEGGSKDYIDVQIQSRLFGRGAMSVRYFCEKIVKSVQGNAEISSTEAYLALLSIMDALFILQKKPSATVLSQSFKKLIKEVDNQYLRKLRTTVLNDLKQEGTDVNPTRLINWVEQNFSYHGNRFDD